jgi:hypothetical protein
LAVHGNDLLYGFPPPPILTAPIAELRLLASNNDQPNSDGNRHATHDG